MKNLLVLAAFPLLGACYEYSPFTPTSDTLGKPIRAELTDGGTAHAVAFVGPGADYIDGNLASLTDSTVTISVTDLGRQNGSEESWKGEPVTLAKADVSSMSLRKSSASRSAALTALVVGGAALVARAVKGSEGTIKTVPGGTPGGR
jgi:hypothetical protein